MTSDKTPLEILRSQGWAVAVHNDYKQGGKAHTFWLFTHPEGIWIKGEGESDEQALNGLPARAYETLRAHNELFAALEFVTKACQCDGAGIRRWMPNDAEIVERLCENPWCVKARAALARVRG